jgi:uncharacterized protein YgiM (DUF1202 family)
MRRIDWKVFVLLGIIISVGVGFLYGTGFLGGDTGEPGSEDDPLATQSYADAAIEQRLQDMDARISSLETKIQSLESELAILGGGTTTTPGTTTPGTGGTGGTGGTTTPGTGTGAPTTSQSNIGKQAAVNADAVNLREAASTSSAIKRKLTPSDTFTITKVDNDWYQVQLGDGTIGWVAGYLVKVK